MTTGTAITAVTARQVFSDRGHPGVECTVVTENGAKGVAVVTAGISVGEYEVQFAYDGGKKWGGRGVQKAVGNIVNTIGPAVIGMDAANQLAVDAVIVQLDGTPNKRKLGGNATAAVSAATLFAGAAALGIPLYQHIGGVHACTLPTPGVLTLVGSKRYGSGQRSGGKPSYSMICYGFDTFSDASYAAWEVNKVFGELVDKKWGLATHKGWTAAGPGFVNHDRELWDVMVETLKQTGYEGKVGFQVDIAAGTYYDKAKERYVGLFSAEDKTRDDLMRLYEETVKNYRS